MNSTLEGRSVAAVISDITSSGHTPISTANILRPVLVNNEREYNPESSEDPTVNVLPVAVELTKSSSNVVPEQVVGSTQYSLLISLVAGALAGALAKTTIAPLDRTKIRFQATNHKFSSKRALKFVVESYRTDGFFSLWRGNSATMARIIPYAAIQFAAHDHWKGVLRIDSPENKNSLYLRFLNGSMAGVTAQSITYPLDMARARMAVTKKCMYASLPQVFVKIWKNEGPLALYRGFTPTILGVIPYAGTSFGIYETLKSYHKEHSSAEKPNPFERMFFGAVAGLVGQTSSYPLDIVRRRMQTAKVTGNGNHYKTIRGTLLKVYREEGVAHGLYKGLSLNWIKGPIAVGISFSCFDTMKIFLEQLVTR